MTVGDVLRWLDGIAPFATQESFDNAGLIVGDPAAEVRRVLFAVDATLPVVREAADWGAELIVAHHPLLFGGTSAIRYDEPEGKIVAALAAGRLNLIAAHTNLDRAPGGTGDSLAAALRLGEIAPAGEDPYLRVGRLAQPVTALDFLNTVDSALGARARLYGDASRPVLRIAVGAGACGERYALAAQNGAEAFVVGEIKHHQLLASLALGLPVLEAGHYETERPGVVALLERFQSAARDAQWPVHARLTAISPYDCATSDGRRA